VAIAVSGFFVGKAGLGAAPGSGSAVTKGANAAPQCGDVRSPFAYLAELRAGAKPDAVGAPDLHVAAFVAPPSGVDALGQEMIVIGTSRADGSPVALQSLKASPAFERVAELYPQSARPDLLSCDYQLADSPAASRFRDLARAALLKAGMSTAEVLDSDTTIWTIGDDPFTSKGVIVSAQVIGKRLTPESEVTGLFGLERFVALLDASGSVTSIGRAAW
jgi:hypothetical protein